MLTEALVGGMTIVGIDFRDGILFVPEVLLAANAMKGGMAILRPLLAETGAPPVGKMVIGTVKGDIHDIGKNLVGMMMEGAGFEVIDLGINCDVDKYLKALEEHKPDILGMSALLTTTMPYMKVVIDTMKEKGIRDDYIVLVGGAPLERGVRRGRGRRRLLPRRRRRGRDRQGLRRAPPQPARRRHGLSPWASRRTLLIACGALARETLAVIEANGSTHLEVTCLSALLHNRPERIPEAVRAQDPRAPRRTTTASSSSTATAAPAASSTGCWPRRASSASPARTATRSTPARRCSPRLAEAEPGTFYLTDFLARQFDTLVIEGLGLDRHPELLPLYFGNYRRLVYLAQTDDPDAAGGGPSRGRAPGPRLRAPLHRACRPRRRSCGTAA